MYKIKVITNFSAAHSLRNYKGKCEALHGHNWKVEAIVSAARLGPAGMVMDFSELKKMAKDVLSKLDHNHLNQLDYFSADNSGGHNPSSEEIAKYIFTAMRKKITPAGCKIDEVRVWETENSCAIYSG